MRNEARSLRTPLGRVRGLGSAKAGTEHWWSIRLTSVALVPLTIWFVISVVGLVGASHADVIDWLSSPIVAVLAVLFLATTFHHTASGLREVIEDYVHGEWSKIAAVLAVRGAAYLLGAIAIFSVLKIAFGG